MKKVITIVLLLGIALSFAACGGIDTEIFAQNHMLAFNSKENDGKLVNVTEYVCDGDYALVTTDAIVYMKKGGAQGGDKLYLLNPADKTGFTLPLENIGDELDIFQYSFAPYLALGAKKTGRDKIAGLPAETYLLEHGGARLKLWVAKKTDIILKRATVNADGEIIADADDALFEDAKVTPSYFEVTQLVAGDVVLTDAVNLEAYTILSASDLLGGSFDPSFFNAFGNSFGSSFDAAFGDLLGNALGGSFAGALGDALGDALGGALDRLDKLGDRLGNALGKIFNW